MASKKNYPEKIKEAMEILVEEGYFKKESEIINIALFEFFKERNLFEAVNKIKLRNLDKK